MENGVTLGERNGGEDEVLEVGVEEKDVVVSRELRESEGDDVFEEAVEAEIPLVDSKDRVDSDDGSIEKVVDFGGSIGVTEDLENGNEVERFEEAIGVPSTILSSDEGIEEKAEVRVSEVSLIKDSGDKVVPLVTEKTVLVEEAVAGDVLANEAERLNNNGVGENGEIESKMVSDLGAFIKTASSKDEDEVNKRSGEVLEKSDDDIVKHVNMDSIHDGVDIDEQEKQINERRETQDANEVEGSDIYSTQEVESNGEIVHQDVKNVEVNKICGTRIELENNTTSHGPVLQGNDTKEQMGIPEENEKDNRDEENDISANHDSIVEEKTENPEDDRPLITSEDSSVKEITKSQDSLSNEAAKASLSSSDSVMKSFGVFEPQPVDANGVVDNPEKNLKKNEEAKPSIPSNTGQEMISSTDNSSSSTVRPEAPARPGGLDIDLNEIKGGDVDSQLEVESNGDIVQQDVKNIEVNEIYPEVDRPAITSEDSSVEDKTKASEVNRSPTSEDSLPGAAAKAPLSSSDSEMQSSGVADPQVTDANKRVSEGVINKTEKKMEKDEEANGSIPSNRGQENRPTIDNSAAAVRPAAPARPAGLGRAAALLEPALRMMQQPRMNGTVSSQQNQLVEETNNGEAEEFDETREKLQMIRVKFLRLAHRLGQTPHNVVVAQVLYRLGLAEQLRGRNGGRVSAFSFDRASAMAEQLEAAGQEPLDFSCTIMVLGKTGVGKSSTINSIFDEVKCSTDPFQLATKKVQEVVGTVQGIKVRVIDTPGLLPSWSDQQQNEKILHSIKKFIKKTPPDIVLYLDRLDMQSRDFGDMPLLRTITDVFGPSIWFNAIVVLTHAASAPPDGSTGAPTGYDHFVTQRSHAVQQAIRQAAGDMRLMNPVSLVENHLACRTNRAGQRVLPNGQIWKPHLLLLSFASKILAEANTLLKLQDNPPGRPFAARTRAPPLPFLLSSLLQSRPQVKLPTEQFDDDEDSLDDDLDESSDSEEESEYDQLPPFRSLTKSQLAKLPRDQRNAYYAEIEYRENLFMKKQLREEKKRRKILKKMQAAAKNLPTDYNGSAEEESNDAASVPVAMPDLSLPASFDSDNPTHRYRCLDSSNQWLVRPVLEPNGWDHDVGYEGINVEKLFVVKEKIPVSFSSQLSKDKKDTNLQMELATLVKHGEGKATSLGFDMQSVGKDIAYTLRGETRFSNYRRNKATAGVSVTILGDVVSGGVKVEDKLIVNQRGQLVVSGGAMFGRGDAAYGGSLEATLRDKDHPMGRFLSTLGLSVMDWHGDLAIGCNSQTQIPIGRYSNLIGRININNRGSGQVSIRLNSSEQLQIVLIALIPFARKLLGYSQTMQYG